MTNYKIAIIPGFQSEKESLSFALRESDCEIKRFDDRSKPPREFVRVNVETPKILEMKKILDRVNWSLVETTLVEFVVDDADFYVIKFDSRRFSIPDDGFHSDYSGGEIRVEFSKLERVIEILKSL